jgi:hypothetical protein
MEGGSVCAAHLEGLDRVRRLDVERDCLTCQSLHKELHDAAAAATAAAAAAAAVGDARGGRVPSGERLGSRLLLRGLQPVQGKAQTCE